MSEMAYAVAHQGRGEQIRFVIRNGRGDHGFLLATRISLKHAGEEAPAYGPDHPNGVGWRLAKSAEILWKFTHGTFNIPVIPGPSRLRRLAKSR
jgi:hypothetical protein